MTGAPSDAQAWSIHVNYCPTLGVVACLFSLALEFSPAFEAVLAFPELPVPLRTRLRHDVVPLSVTHQRTGSEST